MKINPIIAVKDVLEASKWYQEVFRWKSAHGGDEFEILIGNNKEVMLCLHKWGAHEHPTMVKPPAEPGNGVILYFRTNAIDEIYETVIKIGHPFESNIAINPNSRKREFSFRDLDGHYLTIAEHHTFTG